MLKLRYIDNINRLFGGPLMLSTEKLDQVLNSPGIEDFEIRNHINHHIAVTLGYILKPVGSPGSVIRPLRHWNMSKKKFIEALETGALKNFIVTEAVELRVVEKSILPSVSIEDFLNKKPEEEKDGRVGEEVPSKEETKETLKEIDSLSGVDKKALILTDASAEEEEEKGTVVAEIVVGSTVDTNPFDNSDPDIHQTGEAISTEPPKNVVIKKKKN